MKIPKLTDVISHNPLQDSLNVSKRTPTPVVTWVLLLSCFFQRTAKGWSQHRTINQGTSEHLNGNFQINQMGEV